MATVSAQIRLDPEVKARSMELFQSLGLDLSTAVNVFLRQCLIHRGLPFSVTERTYSAELLEAIEEAEQIAHDPSVPSYKSWKDLEEALENEHAV